MSSATSSQSSEAVRSSRTPIHPMCPTYFGTKKRSGSDATRIACTPLGALSVMDVASSLVMTKNLSRIRNAGAVWPPKGRSSASGSARQMARTRSMGERRGLIPR